MNHHAHAALRSLSYEAQAANLGMLSALLLIIAGVDLDDANVRADMAARLSVAALEMSAAGMPRSDVERRILADAIAALR